MTELVFLLEERSAKALIEGLLPRLFRDPPNARYIVFEGKQDLEKWLARRLRGYLVPGARFLVLRDQDSGDCVEIKNRLRAQCEEAGKPAAIVRIACRELESWYLADLPAVERALGFRPRVRRRAFQDPDAVGSPSKELERLAPYQKIGGSRAIAPHLDLDNPRSRSFACFIRSLRRIAEESSSTGSSP